MRLKRSRAAAGAGRLFGAAGIARAQSTTATIRGHVADAQGLALPGRDRQRDFSEPAGYARTVVTSEYGDYVLTLLPPGTYR